MGCEWVPFANCTVKEWAFICVRTSSDSSKSGTVRKKRVNLVGCLSLSTEIATLPHTAALLMMWNLQSYPTTVLSERTNIFRGGQNILWPILHIFMGSASLNRHDLRPCRRHKQYSLYDDDDDDAADDVRWCGNNFFIYYLFIIYFA